MAVPLPGDDEKTPPQAFVFQKYGSLNTQAKRPAIKDEEFSWIENWFPIGDGNMRTLFAEGASIYSPTSPRTIIYQYPYNIGLDSFIAVFLDDGSALQVDIATLATKTIGAAGTFTSSPSLPAASQWQSIYLLIATSGGYWIWDGTALYGSGSLAPDVTVIDGGSGYTSAPTVTAYGGSGTGATFTATVANGVVTTVTTTNAGTGYQLGDHVQLAFSGGGSDTTATAVATVSTTTGGVTSVVISNGGSGYTSAAKVAFSGGGGTGAAGAVLGTGGVITGVQITNPGSGYTAAPTVAFTDTGGGTGAVGAAQLSPGQVISITVLNPGSGYVGNPVITITGDGTGATATSLVNGINSITVTSGGSGYLVPPTVSITGGGGAGATAVAVLTGGVVTAVNVTNTGSGYASTPAVGFTSGTGSGAAATAHVTALAISVTNPGAGYTFALVTITGNRAAQATVDIMPFGMAGTTIETYQSRVWIANNTTVSFTAPSSPTDFGTNTGGGSYQATDSFLRDRVVCLKQANGFLYQFGDSSINVISNVQTQTTGETATTIFNNSNVDPQVGTPWRDSVAAFGRAIVFGNSSGVYALYSGAAEKVSSPLDGLFETATFNTGGSGLTPTSGVATVFGIRVFSFLFTTTDNYTKTQRNLLAMWDGQKWFMSTQLATLSFIATQEIDSVLTTWGIGTTAGTEKLIPLFKTPSTSLSKVYQTKLRIEPSISEGKQTNRLYVVADNHSGVTAALNISVDTEKGVGTAVTAFSIPSSTTSWATPAAHRSDYGLMLGLTGVTTAQDLTLVQTMLLWREYNTYG